MAKAWQVKGIRPKKNYQEGGELILPVRVEEVYSWAEFIRNPDNVRELHNLRISLKRLRYSMELFTVNYGENFLDCLKTVGELQELLGDIHDCDVIEEVLIKCLERASDDEDSDMDAIGINTLLFRYRKTRTEKYEAFVLEWESLEETDFRDRFLKIAKGKSSAT